MSDNKKDLRVVFMGTPDLSAKIFRALHEAGYNIVGVFTQPDKKVGRKQLIEKSPVRILAEENNIPVFTPARLDEFATNELSALQPDLIVLIAYGKILPQTILDLPKYGAINIHPSILPKYRGPSPIQNALLNGDEITGTTIMKMDASMDTGDILAQETITIENQETYSELENKSSDLSIKTLLKILPRWVAGEITPQKQDSSAATYCKMIQKNDGQIDWQDSAQNIYNKYRAFQNWPGIFTTWNGKRLKLNKINFTADISSTHSNGEIFQIDDRICVQAADGAIELHEVQLEGKPSMQTSNFLNGYPKFIGGKLN